MENEDATNFHMHSSFNRKINLDISLSYYVSVKSANSDYIRLISKVISGMYSPSAYLNIMSSMD